MNTDRTPQYIKLDERNHVEKPLLDQLDGLGLGDHRPRQEAASRPTATGRALPRW